MSLDPTAAGPRPALAGGGGPPWRLALALGLAGLALTPLPLVTPNPLAGVASLASLADSEAEERAAAALRDGNRQVRSGHLEEAVAAYAAGWSPGGSPGGVSAAAGVLAYNLGTTAHRLGRSAEAVLWYRRATAARLADPWLADNLALARGEAARAGAVVLSPPGAVGWIATHAAALAWAAVALAWAALALLLTGLAGLARRRWQRRAWPVVGAAALGLWALAAALGAWGPRPAVLLEPCSGPGGGLPAASEVWVGRPAGDARPVLGGPPGLSCRQRALGLIG